MKIDVGDIVEWHSGYFGCIKSGIVVCIKNEVVDIFVDREPGIFCVPISYIISVGKKETNYAKFVKLQENFIEKT